MPKLVDDATCSATQSDNSQSWIDGKGTVRETISLLKRLQQALQVCSLLIAQSHKRHNQHGSSASRDQAPQHENLSHCTLATAGRSTVDQVAAAQHPRLHQALCLHTQEVLPCQSYMSCFTLRKEGSSPCQSYSSCFRPRQSYSSCFRPY